SSQIFDDREVDVDDVDSNSSRGDYARLSMPVESVKRVPQTHPRTTDDLIKEVKLVFEEMTAATFNETFLDLQAVMEQIMRWRQRQLPGTSWVTCTRINYFALPVTASIPETREACGLDVLLC
ncbi:hypothetical protein PF008_g33448, partial [Phytophthora fragariae]